MQIDEKKIYRVHSSIEIHEALFAHIPSTVIVNLLIFIFLLGSKHFTLIQTSGVRIKALISTEGRPDLTHKKPNFSPTGIHPSLRSASIGQQIKFIVINKQANSLHSLIADGVYRATSLGRDTWKSLIGSQGSLQRYCNKEGFNVEGNIANSKARIGIIGNEQSNCGSPDSRIG